MATYAFDNAAQSVTANTVASGATTVTLSATSLFDASGKQYIVRADDSGSTAFMYCLVTSNNTATNVLTWTEGVDGTSAIALGNASTVTEVITKKTINDTMVRLDTGASQTLTGPLVVPPQIGGSPVTTTYGSMPIKVYENLLASTVAAPITITPSIGSNYRHLIIEYQLRMDNAAANNDLYIQFNSDTAAHYQYARAFANGSAMTVTTSAGLIAQPLAGFIAAANATAGYFSTGRISILNFNGTTADKQYFADGSLYVGNAANNQYRGSWSGQWTTTGTAIFNLTLGSSAAGNFIAGSLITIYGIP